MVGIGQLGHDDGSDSQVKAAVVTRCLSPLGTGNDETGFVGPSGASADFVDGTARFALCPPLWKSVVVALVPLLPSR
jgi:hypothetical protein